MHICAKANFKNSCLSQFWNFRGKKIKDYHRVKNLGYSQIQSKVMQYTTMGCIRRTGQTCTAAMIHSSYNQKKNVQAAPAQQNQEKALF